MSFDAMEGKQPNPPIDSLAAQLLDAELSDTERAELMARIRDNGAELDHYVDQIVLHSLLKKELGAGCNVPLEPVQSPAPPIGAPLDQPATPFSSETRGWTGLPLIMSFFTLAVVLGIAVAEGWLRYRVHSEPSDVAHNSAPSALISSVAPEKTAQAAIGRVDRLESHVIIDRAGAKQKAVVGMDILATDSLDVPADGRIELTLVDRSQAMLGPRTMLAFSSGNQANLREGFVQIDARNRRGDVPLAIATPDARMQIQDARLSMGADQKRTQIRVSEGSVRASRRADGLEVHIPEGYCSTIARATDPDPRRSGNGTALLVVSAKAPYARQDWDRFDRILTERIVGDRLWRSAMPVRVRAYDKLQARDLEGCTLVVLSVFPFDEGIEQKLIDLGVPQLSVPIVCLEPAAFPVLGLTGPQKGVDFDITRERPLVVDVAAPSHALAAGFVGEGLDLFAYRNVAYWWGRPAENALTIANVHQEPDRWVLFAYDKGDAMVKGAAPARRVGLFIIPTGADYDSPALDLLDAAIDWCLDSATADQIARLIHYSAEGVQLRTNGRSL